jgi:hypothetical protein
MLAIAGCVTGADLARQRAAREYRCPIDQIKVRWLATGRGGDEVYQVHACGTTAAYSCNDISESCVRETDDRSSAE